jgi:hypothetical protein
VAEAIPFFDIVSRSRFGDGKIIDIENVDHQFFKLGHYCCMVHGIFPLSCWLVWLKTQHLKLSSDLEKFVAKSAG